MPIDFGKFRLRPVAALYALVLVMSVFGTAVGQQIKYQKFTLYNAGQAIDQEEVIVVFHGFESAIPNGAYKRIYEAFSGRFAVVGLNYDYFDIEGNIHFFSEVWNSQLKNKQVIVAGTSLGGFWANFFAGQFGVEKAILVNPVSDPERQLQQFIGRRFSDKRNEAFIVTTDDIAKYGSVEVRSRPNTKRLIILATDDNVLDYRVAQNNFSENPENRILIFENGGGHTLNLRRPEFVNPIRQFLGVSTSATTSQE